MNVSIVIPCLNEIETIERSVKDAYLAGSRYFDEFEVLAADNGSTDGTRQKLTKIKKLKVINVPIRGYGVALHFGILSAKFPYVFFADADLSYDFSQINKFIPYINKGYDLVLGSRIKGTIQSGAMPFANRYIGTPILTFLIRLIYKVNISDCNSGMRLVNKSFYNKLKMNSSGMEWASELLIKAGLHNGKFAEVPITFRRDQRGGRPHLRRWEDGWRHLKVIILLKPIILIYASLLMFSIAAIALPISLFSTIAFSLFAEFFLLTYLVAIKLDAALYKTKNSINDMMDNLPIVFSAVVLTIFGVLQLFIISDSHLFTKYIFLFQTVLIDLWLFFIETIKTNLVNPLPKEI